ncbi:magnesium transporter CorA family protein [Rhizobium sp. KVB221]|uniref:Magnesium transport protein CorA n=1 Tax=Rhizobium setariae TaxID=2801340 RepID=A0A937CP44_9HYPH|nr:magnesium transporter CorA family protein [Rhizobium setariae]MBL0371993.1 magnesium transporter CorA family protein [Rhizobium setariae]
MLRIYAREADRLVRVEANASAPETEIQLQSEVLSLVQPQLSVWYDLVNPLLSESRLVEHELGIALPSRDEMEEIELSARLYQEDGAEFMTITALTDLDSDDPRKTPVTFALKGPSLVSIRYADHKPFDVFSNRAQRAKGTGVAITGESIMIGLLESLIDRMADTLERLANEIDTISRDVFRNKVANAQKKTHDLQSLIEQIGRKGDFLTMVRESLVSISRLISYHTALETSARKISKDARQRIKLIQRDATSLGEHATFMTSKINFLLDATLGLINLEQNQIIKIFTVASVVFLPPTLVASIYGMNFDIMPELKWGIGYPWAMLLMVLSAAMPFLYFKKRGWL